MLKWLISITIIYLFISKEGTTLKKIEGDNHDEICAIDNVAYQGGETLIYKAYYNWGFLWIPAGEAIFKVKDSGSFYEIEVQGYSYKAYDGFFKLRDKFYSKIDKESGVPIEFERKVNEGDYQKYEHIHFNQEQYYATVQSGKTPATSKNSTYQFSSCMHDLLSLLYYMRNINVENYNTGDHIDTQIFFDEEVFPIKVRYLGKYDNYKVKDLGTYNAIKVVPDLISGHVFKDGDQMQVFVSDDLNKIPLIVESPLKIGALKAVLKTYSGLKHPLDQIK